MIYKFLGALIVGAAVAIAVLALKDDFGTSPKAETCVQLTPSQQFAKLIDDDFAELHKTEQLPKEWDSIATIELRLNSQLAKALLGKERPTFKRLKEGTASLELEVMDLPDEENPGVIIQASLFDIKSKNKIFEIGRTYTMEDLNTPPAVNTK